LVLAVVLVIMSSVTAFATQLGSPTPVNSIHPEMFPVGSQQRVDYCHFLNVRSGPGPEHASFTHLARGDIITVLEYSLKWVRVDTSSGQGWIFAGYLARDMANDPPANSGGTVQVGRPTPSAFLSADMFPIGSQATVDFCFFLNVRSGPGREYGAFTHLAQGHVITVLEYDRQWVRVDTASGQGWVFAGYLSNSAVLSATTGTGSAAVSTGSPTPVADIHPDMFPIGSQQTVDYTSFLNVRGGPAVTYAAFGAIARGTVVTVLEYSQKWIRVDTVHGQGWIYAGYLRRPETAVVQQPTPEVQPEQPEQSEQPEQPEIEHIEPVPMPTPMPTIGSGYPHITSVIAEADRTFAQALSTLDAAERSTLLEAARVLYIEAVTMIQANELTHTFEYQHSSRMAREINS